MKQYHTEIEINADIATVWIHLTDFKEYPKWNPIVGKLEGIMEVGQKISTYIVPLGKTYKTTLLFFEKNKGLTWQGILGAKFLLAGKHYYKLESLTSNKTRLSHGEYFTGLFSFFIRKSLLTKMEKAFNQHNSILKQRIEKATIK